MKIEYKNYVITPPQHGGGFDLSRKVTRKKMDKTTKEPTGETYEAEKIIGYNMGVETIIQHIIEAELSNNNETISLERFLEEYKREKNEILESNLKFN